MKRIWVVGFSLLVACAGDGADARYPRLQDDGEPLRSAFNQAAGKVRAVFLAAPT